MDAMGLAAFFVAVAEEQAAEAEFGFAAGLLTWHEARQKIIASRRHLELAHLIVCRLEEQARAGEAVA